MSNYILITGATGLIGQHLQALLIEKGYAIRTLTTQKVKSDGKQSFFWQPSANFIDENAFKDVDYIIHLAGASIGEGRWTKRRKTAILDSRVNTTRLLFEKVRHLSIPLKAFISASATGIYGSKTSETIFDEYSPVANDFLGDVCHQWEKAANAFSSIGIRTVTVRTGVVISKNAPALQKMLLPIKYGIGSPLGNGRQYMPWIHLDDLCRVYLRAVEDEQFTGSYNAVAPRHYTNREWMRTLARQTGKAFWFPPVPGFMLKLILGEMAIIILEGSRVHPRRLLAVGFEFHHRELELE